MRKFILMFFAFSIINTAQVAVNPTRPSASDNAFTTAQGYSEIEFGFSSTKNNWTLPLLLKFGMLQNFELGFSMNGLVNSINNTEIGNPGLQLKYRFLDKGRLSIALVGKTEFIKNLDPAYTFYAVPSIVAEAFQVDATFGIKIADDGFGYNSSFIHAVSLSPNIDEKFGMFAEIFGEMTTNFNPIYLDGGISYKLNNSFVVDTSISYGLNDDAGKDITFQIGFTSLIFKLF